MFLLTNLQAVTVDPQRRIFSDAAIAIDGDRIADVGRRDELVDKYREAEHVDCQGTTAIPGLIDCHAHTDQAILRGLGDDLHWVPFLSDVIYPLILARTSEHTKASFLLASTEMILGGTTCLLDPNVQPSYPLDDLVDLAGQTGIRAVLARAVSVRDGTPDEGYPELEQACADVEAVRSRAGDQLQVWLGPELPRQLEPDYQPDFLDAVVTAAQRAKVGIVYHFSSESEDVEFYEKTFGIRPVRFASDHRLLGPATVIIGGGWLSTGDMGLLAGSGTKVVHTPVANMKMASGVAPVPELLRRGVGMALGTDGGANNNTHDMFAEMKTAVLLANSASGSAGSLTAHQVLEMATIGGAAAIGLESQLGSLEAGKLADIVLVDFDRPRSSPVFDPVSALVYTATAQSVSSVLVGGKFVVRDGRHATLDTHVVADAARRAAEDLLRSAGLTPPRPWPVIL